MRIFDIGCAQKKNVKKVSDASVVEPQPKAVVQGGEGEQKSPEPQKKENNGGGGGVVLKMDLHCDGCASKVVKFIRAFPGVEAVKVDWPAGKLTVNGKADPAELRAKLEEKTHKKVELLSPVPKKENPKGKDGNGDTKGDKLKDAKDESNNKNKDSKGGKDEKAPKVKEPAVSTAVLKVSLHCEGCIHKICKIVSKTKGYEDIKVDKEKDLVTVKGSMDMKALAENLKKHLKRAVEIVPPKKEEKKETGGGNGGGDAKPKAAAGGANGGGEKMEGNKMQVQPPPHFGFGPMVAPPHYGFGAVAAPPPMAPYGYPSGSPYMYPPPPPLPAADPYQINYNVHAPQMFSDENPNACSIM